MIEAYLLLYIAAEYRSSVVCESACNNDPPLGQIGVQN